MMRASTTHGVVFEFCLEVLHASIISVHRIKGPFIFPILKLAFNFPADMYSSIFLFSMRKSTYLVTYIRGHKSAHTKNHFFWAPRGVPKKKFAQTLGQEAGLPKTGYSRLAG